MNELTIEQKAQRYDEALEKAKDFYKGYNQRDNQLYADDLESIFPELKESKDVFDYSTYFINYFKNAYGENSNIRFAGIKVKDIIAWLEKQSEHANFRNKIQVGDKVTRNEDGMLVNLSQLNRVAKKDEKQGEQKPTWSEKDEKEVAVLEAYIRSRDWSDRHIDRALGIVNDLVSKVKSLRLLKWKPTEEQLKELEKVFSPYTDSWDEDILRELYKQLKQL